MVPRADKLIIWTTSTHYSLLVRCSGACYTYHINHSAPPTLPRNDMSAIVITTASYPSERTPLLRSGSYSSDSDSPNEPVRSAPLKDSISLSRFVVVCIGIWSANFVFAFQSTAIPTLAPEIGSWFEHGELSAYLGSMFTLSNTAGMFSPLSSFS